MTEASEGRALPLLSQITYPWSDPVAQDLHRTLIALLPSVSAIVQLAEEVGIQRSCLLVEQPAAQLLKDVLDKAARAGELRSLVDRVLTRLAPSHPAARTLRQLSDDEAPDVNSEPRADDGAPGFVHADDTVFEDEARLFGDDLTVQLGLVPGLIEALRHVLRISPAVCKLTVGFGHGGQQHGTAFRIGPDLVLTNWHVVHRRSDAAPTVTVSAEFGYEDDASGRLLTGSAVDCDPEPVHDDAADDWAVLRTRDPLDDAWPVVSLADLPTPKLHGPAYIVQHPNGDRKRVGFVRNRISYVDDRVVHYLTDTDVGSSGAPVLDAYGRLLALHHRGGRPQDTLFATPVRKNEGIRMSRIATALRVRGLSLA